MMIINTPVNPDPAGMLAVNPDARRGPRKTLTGVPCKTGIAWSFDAATGEFLWAKPTVEQNLVARIDPKGLVTVNENSVLKEVGKTYHICPTYNGGRDWPQGAYNPRSNVMFMPLTNLCIDSTARTDRTAAPQFVYNTTNIGKFATGKDKVGRIDAISVETGKTLWSWETRVSNYSPILATGGGLLFNGSMDRYLRALDADNGNVLWQTRLSSQAVGGTVTYSVNGRQYIAIAAGGGAIAAIGVGMTPEADTTDRQQRDVRLRAPAIACLPVCAGRSSYPRSGREDTCSGRQPGGVRPRSRGPQRPSGGSARGQPSTAQGSVRHTRGLNTSGGDHSGKKGVRSVKVRSARFLDDNLTTSAPKRPRSVPEPGRRVVNAGSPARDICSGS